MIRLNPNAFPETAYTRQTRYLPAGFDQTVATRQADCATGQPLTDFLAVVDLFRSGPSSHPPDQRNRLMQESNLPLATEPIHNQQHIEISQGLRYYGVIQKPASGLAIDVFIASVSRYNGDQRYKGWGLLRSLFAQ